MELYFSHGKIARTVLTHARNLTRSISDTKPSRASVVIASTSQYSLLNCLELDQIFPCTMDTQSRLKKRTSSYYKILWSRFL